jgi:biotin carboxyl carrier protein
MNAMTIHRGLACWLCLSLTGAALFGQVATGEDPNQRDPQNSSAQEKEYVRQFTAQLKTREIELDKLQVQLKQAEADKQALSGELQQLRQALDAVVAEKESLEERAKRRLDGMAAMMGQPAVRRPANETPNGPSFDPFQGAGSKLDEARPGQNAGPSNEVDAVWKRLMDRAEVMLEQARRNEEAAAKYQPKLESAVTQLRKAGRNQDADELLTIAGGLLGRPLPRMTGDEQRPEVPPRDAGHPHAWGDVEHAVDALRLEVGQLRGEIRELRRLLDRGANDNESNQQRRHGVQDRQSDAQARARDLVSMRSRYSGEVLQVGDAARPVRVGDRIKKGEALAVLWSEGLMDLLRKLADARKRLELDLRVCKQLEAVGAGVVPERQLLEAKCHVEEDEVVVGTLTRSIRLWPLSEEAVSQRLTRLESEGADVQTTTLGEFALAAPADGTIVERNLSVGDVVNPGAILFQIEVDVSE